MAAMADELKYIHRMNRLAALFFTLVTAGCSDDTSGNGDDDLECLVRQEVYREDAEFDYEPAEDSRPLEECVPTCNQDEPPLHVDGIRSVVALPAGECGSERSCDM